jgi:long-subunit acyl-CoA synthetase (AMP-forming)
VKIESLLGDTPRVLPGQVALDDGARAITYSQLATLVAQEARFLLAGQGLRFGLLADNGCAWAIADLAIHHLHRLNVPLPGWFTWSQLQHVVTDAGIDTLVTDRPDDALEIWPEFRVQAVSPFSGLTVLQRKIEAEMRPAVPFGTAKVTYTSGSTAEPKGVCLSTATLNCVSRSLVNASSSLGIRRHLCLMPLPTLLENIAGIHAALRAGATCLVPSLAQSGMSFGGIDPQRLLQTVVRAQPESVVLVPELLRLLVRAAQSGMQLPASLKFIAVGGATVSRSLLDEAADAGLPVFEGYGLSECASVVCLNTPHQQRRGSVGRPLSHVRVSLDQSGQIMVEGAVMSGYLGDPSHEGPTRILTGDLGELDEDGFLYVRGRTKNIFITSLGRNVSPEWVESELAHEPVIRHAIAFGEAQPAVTALLSPARQDVSGDALQAAVERANARLPAYARIGRWIRMSEPPSFSNGLLTANGRVRREQALAQYRTVLNAAS